jgi:hypothetical protein
MGDRKGACKVLVGTPGRYRPLERPRYKWEDDIKMDLQKVGKRGMDQIDLAQDSDRLWVLVNAVTNFWVP